MIHWIRNHINTWLGVTALREEVDALKTTNGQIAKQLYDVRRFAHDTHSVLSEHTRFAADISFNRGDKSFVVVAGKYRNHDYVNCVYISDEDMNYLVPTLKQMGAGYDKRIHDAPPSFKAFHYKEG